MEGLLSSSLTAAAPWVLLCFWLWYTLEAIYVGKKTKNYRPVPLSKNPVRKSGDVSIVVCTIGPVGNFVLCVERWLANNPRELIFVTIDSQMDAIQALIDEACTTLALPPAQCKKISLLSVGPCANKRAQMIKGVNAATGSIIATVDDHIMWEYTFLEYTLSCFDDPTVGGVGPMNGVYIPPERRHEAVITPWEVIIMTHQGWQVDGFPKKSVAADWVWCIAGTTALYVATILRDPEFQAAHLNDVWMGRVQNASDDIFIARWCQARNWRLLCQAMPETRILRTAHQRRDLLQKQLLRWHRSCLQTCLRSLWEVPQIYRKPYALIKTVGKLFRAPLWLVHTAAWVMSFSSYPRFTTVLLLYYACGLAPNLAGFFAQYPYTTKHLWAVVLTHLSGPWLDLWAWLTITDVTWGSRDIPEERCDDTKQAAAWGAGLFSTLEGQRTL